MGDNKVELFVAYTWACPNCQHRNYCEGEEVKLSPEEERSLHVQHDEPIPDEYDLVQGEWCVMPKCVECAGCGKSFETVDPRDIDSAEFGDQITERD